MQDIPQEETEIIESYLLDTMAPGERIAFETKLSGDAALQEKVSGLQLLLLGVNEALLREKMNEFHKRLPVKEAVMKTGRESSSLKSWLVAASVLLVACLGVWLLTGRQTNAERAFATYFKPDPGLLTAMSATTDYAFENAMIDYKKGDYNGAIRSWDSLQKTQPATDTLNYFLGVAHLANGNFKEAVIYLKKVTVQPSGFFRADAFWYYGLALLKEGKKAEAVQSIEQSAHPGKEKLLQELKSN